MRAAHGSVAARIRGRFALRAQTSLVGSGLAMSRVNLELAQKSSDFFLTLRRHAS